MYDYVLKYYSLQIFIPNKFCHFPKKVKGGSRKNLHFLTDIVYNQSFIFFIYLEYMCTGTLLYLNTS